MFMIWMQFLIDLFTVWSEDTWLQEYAGKTADKKSTEDPEGETEKSVVSSMVTCRSVRPNKGCLVSQIEMTNLMVTLKGKYSIFFISIELLPC